MKQVSKKIMVWSVTSAFLAGVLGGALTNEYFIAYLVDLMGGKIQDNDPIVKRVVEEKVYVESSQTIDAVKKVAPALVSVQLGAQNASGFLVSSDGLLMTALKPLGQTNIDKPYEVILNGGQKVTAKFMASDEVTGMALLKITDALEVDGKVQAFPVIEFADVTKMDPGQTVLSLEATNMYASPLVRQGVLREQGYRLSFKDYKTEVGDKYESFMLMVDTGYQDTIGGALINLSGQVVGMVIDDSTDGTVISSAMELKLLMDSYLADAKFVRPDLGFAYAFTPYGDKSGENLFSAVQFAAKVTDVKDAGLISKSGIKVGDLVLELAGKPLVPEKGLYYLLRQYKADDEAVLKVMRDGTEIEVKIKF